MTSEEHFRKLKAVCVPIMERSRLTPSSISSTITLLDQLNTILAGISPSDLTPSLITYTFLPLSTILQRNVSADIPDQVLEKLLNAIALLVEVWWWTCEDKIWEQIFMLCGAIVGGIEARGKGKGKDRDEESKEAATKCLFALLRPRSPEDAIITKSSENIGNSRLSQFQTISRSDKFVPIVGQTLDSLLGSAQSPHIPLQRTSLDVVALLLDLYLPDPLLPTVLPGVVSTMTKVCFGSSGEKGWANGDIVARALKVMRIAIVNAIGDDLCIRDGALRPLSTLDDLADFQEIQPSQSDAPPYGTRRTQSWMKGTGTQLHIAINALSSLVSHPTPSALHSLVSFSTAITLSTPLSLPQTQPLLLSFLLSVSLSDYKSVSNDARQSLTDLLTRPSNAQASLHQTLLTNVADNLSALPHLISMQSDAKVEHAAGLIEAVCRLSTAKDPHSPLDVISKGVGRLLGPTGGIEKWGWSLLSVLEFEEPPIVVTHTSGAQLALEVDPDLVHRAAFPQLGLKNISSYSTRKALENMLHALGASGGDTCLFSVEWFSNVGQTGTSATSVAALWCACRLLEGIAEIALFDETPSTTPSIRSSKRLEKQVRSLAKMVAELWDKANVTPEANTPDEIPEDRPFLVQHRKGLVPLHENLKIFSSAANKLPPASYQPVLHRALCLHIIALAAGITQARFNATFIHTLYPVLHSLVSPVSFLSSTGLAVLDYVTIMTSYASPRNLLLSNFDYVLNSVSRRLSGRWLDVDATQVLVLMVRLVGPDIVDNAGDVVEECFDRLDEYHGYGIVVDGLMEVLAEIVLVIKNESRANVLPETQKRPIDPTQVPYRESLGDLIAFLPKRFEDEVDKDDTDYGPAPQEPWGKDKPTDEPEEPKVHPNEEPPLTPIQALTKQIISRSMYFLTHDSPIIRARVLDLLSHSVSVLSHSALLPSIHSVWPFVLNRLKDPETFVVSAAAKLVEVLALEVGSFMFRRIWDDVWPIFRSLLRGLEAGESTNALTRARSSGVAAETAYTHSHRLYRSILRTMAAALQGVHLHEASFWQLLISLRRFLGTDTHEDLQRYARDLYIQANKLNPDTVWLVLNSTIGLDQDIVAFLKNQQWNIEENVNIILGTLLDNR